MENETIKNTRFRYWRPLPLILGLSILCIGSVVITAAINHMDVPTYIRSWNTKKVTVEEIQQGKLAKPVIFIDVRSPEEYDEDHIANSKLIPLIDIEAGFGKNEVVKIAQNSIKTNRTQPTIVLYCTSGLRSTKAYQVLESSGLNLATLKGGITAWRKVIPPEKDTEILLKK